ncbi:hypothetical protein [Leptolyngbya phage Lbo-JY16]
MTNPNNAELRRLAENAEGSFGQFDPSESEQEFMARITPTTVLSLLDQCEGLLAQHARDSATLRELCQARDDARKQSDKAEAERDAALAERDEWERLFKSAGNVTRNAVADRDQLRDKLEAPRQEKTDWQKECLKKGFEYVRESDDHYVVADPAEMVSLLRDLLGIDVRQKNGSDYGVSVSDLEEQIDGLVNTIHMLEQSRKDAETESARLNLIVNSPQSDDFLRAVSTEAEHQRQRWDSEHDSGKQPADWFWLVGYLAGKALHAHAAGDTVKGEHHVITTAAALANWHSSMFGNTKMRPGIDGDAAISKEDSHDQH